MDRRAFLRSLSATVAVPLCACGREAEQPREVMTVRGRVSARDLGFTLTHEHLLASFQPYSEWAQHPLAYDRDEVVNVVMPHLVRIREMGCRTFVDATAAGLGRDATLIARLSELSGLHMLAATGNYAARDNQFLPPYVFNDNVQQLAARWIAEWNDGIDGTSVRPGFIKLGFNGKALTDVETKLIRAAAITHLATGLTIGAHTGPAVAALEQLAKLDEAGVHPSAWIWIHAQSEPDLTQQVNAAKRGAWISFDGVSPDSVAAHVTMISRLRGEGLIGQVLVSRDAGWYNVGQPRGGSFRAYDTVFTKLIPSLRNAGFTAKDIDTLFIDNPSKAFAIGVRRG